MSALPQPVEPEASGYHETPSMILPAMPPRELDLPMEAAAERVDALAASGRQIHFAVDARGELRVELHDLTGNVLRALSPTQAVSLMGGLGQV